MGSSASMGDGAGRVREQVEELSPWFHNLHLPDGTQTAPDHPLGDFPRFKWGPLGDALPEDLTGWTALDVGCNAGFYSFRLAERGAEVVGVDVDPRYLEQARWAARQFGVEDRVRFERRQVYDLVRDDTTYDLVLFLGVMYHLRYPLLGLDCVAQKAERLLAFQCLLMDDDEEEASEELELSIHDTEAMADAGWPRMAFIEEDLQGDPSNWWVPNRACAEAMLRNAGLLPVEEVGMDQWVCEVDPEPPATVTWDRSELLAATGRSWEEAADRKTQPTEDTLETTP